MYTLSWCTVAMWGLDEHGCFRSDEELRGRWLSALNPLTWCRSSDAATTSTGSVAQRVLGDLTAVHLALATEVDNCTEVQLTDKEKGKRLMYLFQCDLLPGVSGKILEAKTSRDNIAVKKVSWQAKAAGWAFVGMLNTGMLVYVLLFALNQSTHRQGAWALSFLMWLIVEVFMVSSAAVLFTHVLVPSLIMKDVNKIKSKLADSIRAFNTAAARNRRTTTQNAEDPASFSTTEFLFLSSRLAEKWSDLREARIIAQFRTPWPKQSYQREANVSGAYSKRFSALNRSFAILIIFFVSNLLQLPSTMQDMVVNVVATVTIGYTVVLHVDLYKIYPVLVVLPIMLVGVVAHFFVNTSRARLARSEAGATSAETDAVMVDGADPAADLDADSKFAAIVPACDYVRSASRRFDQGDNSDGPLHAPTPTVEHKSRRASLRHGLHVLRAMRRDDGHSRGEGSQSDGSQHSLSDESSDSSDVSEDNGHNVIATAAAPNARFRQASSAVIRSLKAREQQLRRSDAAGKAREQFRRLSTVIVASLKNKDLQLDHDEQREFDDLFLSIDAEEAQGAQKQSESSVESIEGESIHAASRNSKSGTSRINSRRGGDRNSGNRGGGNEQEGNSSSDRYDSERSLESDREDNSPGSDRYDSNTSYTTD
jgi:hypothetical protein